MPAQLRTYPVRLLVAALTVATVLLGLLSSVPHQPLAQAAPGSPAVTPPLGWNSWNSFGCGVTELAVRQNGTTGVLWSCNGQANQQWQSVRVS